MSDYILRLQAVLGPLRAERDALLARHRQVLKRLEAEKDTYMSQVGHVNFC
jgi:hypothetical protein